MTVSTKDTITWRCEVMNTQWKPLLMRWRSTTVFCNTMSLAFRYCNSALYHDTKCSPLPLHCRRWWGDSWPRTSTLPHLSRDFPRKDPAECMLTNLRTFPPRSIVLAGRSPRRKKVRYRASENGAPGAKSTVSHLCI